MSVILHINSEIVDLGFPRIIGTLPAENFDYFPLVWYFSSVHSLQKIERIQEHAPRFLYNDQVSSYDDLLSKSGRCNMHVSRIKLLCISISKL